MSLPGSFQATKKDGTIYYRSSITYKSKHISLGSFAADSDAHTAYLQAGSLIQDTTLSLDHYTSNSLLSFEKWVILINFRDNDMYFGTPIYVRPKFFYYYLTPKIRLIFDIDDLFFYASHKISRRGNHLFVADYGMQLSIHSRYGIKNYAVLNKDYRFINDDIHDYRYENIEILNPYHGVSFSALDSKKKYCAKLHLRGNYTIGYYETALEAAIAYNKAIDIVQKNGCRKKFSPNYMEGLSPSVYAEIYSKLKVSEKLFEIDFSL